MKAALALTLRMATSFLRWCSKPFNDRIPAGYEDATGFHYGEAERKSDPEESQGEISAPPASPTAASGPSSARPTISGPARR